MTPLAQPHPDGVIIEAWVVPGASRSEITGVHDDALRIRVVAPPEKGKANAETADLLSELCGGAQVEQLSGFASRRKVFLVRSATLQGFLQRLQARGIELPE